MVSVGIDEVGRGCWAGPLVVGAVILRDTIPGLKDSKKLSKSKREQLTLLIEKEAEAIGIGWISAARIDEVGLSIAMSEAIELALKQIHVPYDQIIIDGNINYLPDNPKSLTLINADDLEPSVSAASIIAKVKRDKYMAELSVSMPEYGFEKHVGYGTKLHVDKLKIHGITEYHRKSFKPVAAML
ncbi:MAG: ribonuclease HII [Candidatus Saccharimonadales bacterium]